MHGKISSSRRIRDILELGTRTRNGMPPNRLQFRGRGMNIHRKFGKLKFKWGRGHRNNVNGEPEKAKEASGTDIISFLFFFLGTTSQFGHSPASTNQPAKAHRRKVPEALSPPSSTVSSAHRNAQYALLSVPGRCIEPMCAHRVSNKRKE